ncbi:hypothetical protein LVD15_26770 [Fulvivirga maritima]|uniref:TolB family protein n=1 Tax=Fulvivirga maritima TaxID=2904247 RepID=UPI001F44E0FA|nr:hypothetical protein [Fulvivirga maritima]UII26853.1 hypothetical protein LVD15_26770 [Fulvivirga maritima]
MGYFGTYPNFDWSPDDKFIYFWAEGKIKEIDVSSLQVTEVPFEVENTIKIAEALKFKRDINPDKFEVKDIRNAVTSPDGKRLVFNALGRLYRKELPNGEPERITSSKEFEFEPAFTPDGNTLVYVSWEDESMGAVKKVSLKRKKKDSL